MSQKTMSVLIAGLMTAFSCASFAATTTVGNSATHINATGSCLLAVGVTGLPQISAELAQLEKDKKAMEKDKNPDPKLKAELATLTNERLKIKDQLNFPVIRQLRAASNMLAVKTGKPLTYEKCHLVSPTLAAVRVKQGIKVSVEIVRQSLDGKVHVIQNIVDQDPIVADVAFSQMRDHNAPLFAKYLNAYKANKVGLAKRLKSEMYKLNAEPVETSFKDATVQIDTSKDKDAQSVSNEIQNVLNNAPIESAPVQSSTSVGSGAQNS